MTEWTEQDGQWVSRSGNRVAIVARISCGWRCTVWSVRYFIEHPLRATKEEAMRDGE